MEQCGLTPAQAIGCATADGARSIGLQDRMGTVEAGKLANFVVLAEDPTEGIDRLHSILSVVKRGRRHDRADATATTTTATAADGNGQTER